LGPERGEVSRSALQAQSHGEVGVGELFHKDSEEILMYFHLPKKRDQREIRISEGGGGGKRGRLTVRSNSPGTVFKEKGVRGDGIKERDRVHIGQGPGLVNGAASFVF